MKRTILLLLLITLISGGLKAQKTYALVMAVQNYDNPFNRQPKLYSTVSDAKAFYKVLKNAGVSASFLNGHWVYNFNVEKKLNELVSITEAKPNEYNLIIYFAGHGAPDVMCFWDGNYTYQKLFSILAKAKAKNIFVFVDNCFSGTGGQLMERLRNTNPDMVNPQMTFFSACRADEVSSETAIYGHGYFTMSLIEALSGACDSNHDKSITPYELIKWVNPDVVMRCEKFNSLPVNQRTMKDGEVITYNMHPMMFGPGSKMNEPILKWK